MKGPALLPYAAYLRVYEPLEALTGPVAESYRTSGEGAVAHAPHGVLVERLRGLTGLLAVPPVAIPAHDTDEAFVLRVDDRAYLCPWDTRLRCWVSLEELRNTVPQPVLDAFLPRVVIDDAETEFARWRAAHPGASPHILTNPWQVPLRWFVPFTGGERTVEAGRLYYRATMADARRRVARALQVLKRTMDDGPMSEGVAELGRWLEDFHPRSIVELDYGGLAALVPAADLEADTSAADVHEALAALASGDGEEAVARYRSLVERWRVVGDYANAS